MEQMASKIKSLFMNLSNKVCIISISVYKCNNTFI